MTQNIKESAASRVRQETGKRETSYKDSTFMNTTENYKNVHMFTATVFCRSNPMNSIAVLIKYLQFYKSFSKEPENLKFMVPSSSSSSYSICSLPNSS